MRKIINSTGRTYIINIAFLILVMFVLFSCKKIPNNSRAGNLSKQGNSETSDKPNTSEKDSSVNDKAINTDDLSANNEILRQEVSDLKKQIGKMNKQLEAINKKQIPTKLLSDIKNVVEEWEGKDVIFGFNWWLSHSPPERRRLSITVDDIGYVWC